MAPAALTALAAPMALAAPTDLLAERAVSGSGIPALRLRPAAAAASRR
jgi:hypothetical protein